MVSVILFEGRIMENGRQRYGSCENDQHDSVMLQDFLVEQGLNGAWKLDNGRFLVQKHGHDAQVRAAAARVIVDHAIFRPITEPSVPVPIPIKTIRRRERRMLLHDAYGLTFVHDGEKRAIVREHLQRENKKRAPRRKLRPRHRIPLRELHALPAKRAALLRGHAPPRIVKRECAICSAEVTGFSNTDLAHREDKLFSDLATDHEFYDDCANVGDASHHQLRDARGSCLLRVLQLLPPCFFVPPSAQHSLALGRGQVRRVVGEVLFVT
mmetsp:Transcript_9386/g.24585  ORF Transcript_9386/g.24585 Transcript_9386/m.24585 type:complete len:268 (-) Transcript_9386:715-1518(-)